MGNSAHGHGGGAGVGNSAHGHGGGEGMGLEATLGSTATRPEDHGLDGAVNQDNLGANGVGGCNTSDRATPQNSDNGLLVLAKSKSKTMEKNMWMPPRLRRTRPMAMVEAKAWATRPMAMVEAKAWATRLMAMVEAKA